MMLSLWMMTQFVLITLVVAFGTSQPQSPAQAALLGAVGILALAPIITAFVCARRATFTAAAPTPRAPSPWAVFRTFRVAAAPGTPGTVLARAPSRLASPLA
ncbi:hypothetical protein ACI1US_00327 [Leucobacter sp. BZR 635]